jgi:Polynucleotide kinase 3 phosphatase
MLEPRSWTKFRRVAHSAGTCDPRLPAAAFDFDSTLSFLAGGAETVNLVIVPNRSSPDPSALAPLRAYVAALDARTGAARATVYAPTARDRDRKPHTWVWEHYLAGACGGAPPPFAFFCGDAAGRPGDFSASDYAFALNNGLAFVTPEALFYGGADPWAADAAAREGWAAPAPACFARAAPGAPGPYDALEGALSELQEGTRDPVFAVILTGSPASGKTRLGRGLAAYLGEPGAGYAIVSRDAQGAGHKAAFAAALRDRRDVVVDNTNPTAADRAAFAIPAAAAGHIVVLCHVDTPKDACFHLNAARCQLDPTGATLELPPVALHTYWARREAPTAAEAAALGATLVVIPFALAADAPREVAELRYGLR